jgi:hypothetical protein
MKIKEALLFLLLIASGLIAIILNQLGLLHWELTKELILIQSTIYITISSLIGIFTFYIMKMGNEVNKLKALNELIYNVIMYSTIFIGYNTYHSKYIFIFGIIHLLTKGVINILLSTQKTDSWKSMMFLEENKYYKV